MITWQLTKVESPFPTSKGYHLITRTPGKIRIGTPFATTDRVVIKTKKETYILFTTNSNDILNKIQSY
ncbi:SunI/YnzG family protein [Bacillus sp. FSL W8-1127]|uniref:SunI/YnzG family protein n=1 Tax=unclassified Bacillus (in: firmicutes) TaxID=185979 RepID=UPI004046A0F0